MRYIFLGLIILLLFSVITLMVIYSHGRVAYSPPDITCRIDDDCTQCADSHAIVYGQCVNAKCTYGVPHDCPSLGPKWSAQCINNVIAYCFSTP